MLAFLLSAALFAAAPAPQLPPAPKEPIRLVIDADHRTITAYSQGRAFRQYPCAVGKSSTPTPLGEWSIRLKSRDWGGGFGTRWLELSVPFGKYGVHGTNNPGAIGTFASHGCIRMFNRNVEELFRWVQVGTPVSIIGTPSRRTVFEGDRGAEIMEMQLSLERLGYYEGPISGIFTPQLLESVLHFQKTHGIRPDGVVGKSTWEALGLYPPRPTRPNWDYPESGPHAVQGFPAWPHGVPLP